MRRGVRDNKERNQVLAMASGDVQDEATRAYIANLKDLDEK